MTTLMIVRAVKVGRSKWQLVADNGDKPMEGYLHKSAHAAYEACAMLYPWNSVWQGQKVKNGYAINIS